MNNEHQSMYLLELWEIKSLLNSRVYGESHSNRSYYVKKLDSFLEGLIDVIDKEVKEVEKY